MTVTITPEPEWGELLRSAAAARGQDVNTFATTLLKQIVTGEADYAEDASVSTEEAALLRPGIERGLQAEREGRFRPLAQVVAEAQEKFNLPADWGASILETNP